jgi:hypothetical protein
VERQYAGEVEFLGVAWHDTRAAMQDFVDRYGIRMPTAVDETDQIFTRFGFAYQPAWAFVSADGTVQTVFGALGQDGMRAELDALVAG